MRLQLLGIIAIFIGYEPTLAGTLVEFPNLPGRELIHLTGYLARPGAGLSALIGTTPGNAAPLSGRRRAAWLRGYLQSLGGDRRSARRVRYVALVIDTLGPRSMDGGCYSGTFVDQAFDAYAAFRYLSTLKFVDAERVALGNRASGSLNPK
ncbi:MAG: hypothetical protein JO320_22055 [Alphaproteobacteria bacterium]|nr:hypothetical protein [Alphaproteobacteria bacterium]